MKKGIKINEEEFNFVFISSETYQLTIHDQKKADELRLQCDFTLHGIDVRIQPWRQFLHEQLHSIIVSNYNPWIKRSEIAKVVEKYAGAPLVTAAHLRNNNALGKPVSIFSFLLVEHQQRALRLNGKKPNMGKNSEPLKVVVSLTKEEQDRQHKERTVAGAHQAQKCKTTAERKQDQLKEREEKYQAALLAREEEEEDCVPSLDD